MAIIFNNNKMCVYKYKDSKKKMNWLKWLKKWRLLFNVTEQNNNKSISVRMQSKKQKKKNGLFQNGRQQH